MEYVLAVDGGNTKTVACVTSRDGSICGIGRSGCSDIYNLSAARRQGISPVDVALANIDAAVAQALQTASIQPAMLTTGAFNLAGADWPEDYALLQSAMQARHYGRIIHVQNDALGVLHAGSEDNIGVAVICGTGAATGARGYDGRIWHSSFWQRAQGSEDLSKQVLDAVIRAELGLGEPTRLTQSVLTFFGHQTVQEVLHALTARNSTCSEQARGKGLTTLLLDEADTGDHVARHLIQQHGHALGDEAAVAARYVGIERTDFTLVLAGGVLRHPTTLLAQAITERVREYSPGLWAVRSPSEPIIGVIFMALAMAGVVVDATIRDRVSTYPSEAFFTTSTI